MDKLRTAVVGFGKMGVLHGALAKATGLAEVIAIVDKSPRISKAFSRALKDKVTVFTDVEELRDLSPHVVYVTTPIPSHSSITSKVVDLGAKGIFVEKTLSDDAKTSKILSEKASSRNITTSVGYHKRFVPTFNHVKRLLEKETVGAVEEIHAYAYSEDFLGPKDCKRAACESIARSRGGALRDLGSHAIDMALWFVDCKDPRITYAKAIGTPPSDEITVNLVANSVNVTVSTCWGKAGYRMPEVGFRLNCSKGQISVTDDEVVIKRGLEEKRVYRVQLGEKVGYLLAAPEYFVENLAFLERVNINTKFPGADFREASLVDEILDETEACLHASASRR